MNGWGKFKGRVKSNYTREGNSFKKFINKEEIECWNIHAEGVHNKLGTSTVDYIFNKDYGFIEMNYLFYDGTIINFVMEKVELK